MRNLKHHCENNIFGNISIPEHSYLRVERRLIRYFMQENALRRLIAFHFLLVIFASLPARAETTNLPVVADTYMRNSSADVNYGADTRLLVGIALEPYDVRNRALFRFDFSGIPTNATITGVTLTTQIFRSVTDPADFDLNRMLVDWAELEATWSNRLTSVAWLEGGAQSGTEFVATPSATAEMDGGVFSSPGMMADVQMWLQNPGTNFGWILKATGEAIGTGKQLTSRESQLPWVLTVDYSLTPVTPAVPPILYGMELTAEAIRFSFNAESNRAYTVESRDALTASNWVVITNFSSTSVARTINITNFVTSSERYFRARTP